MTNKFFLLLTVLLAIFVFIPNIIDGIVNIPDLVSVASNFGQMGDNIADVNNDKIMTAPAS